MASRKWLTPRLPLPVPGTRDTRTFASNARMAARIRHNLVALLLPTLSGTVGSARLGFLACLALPKGLLHAPSCMPI
jgi:hypothetical protein